MQSSHQLLWGKPDAPSLWRLPTKAPSWACTVWALCCSSCATFPLAQRWSPFEQWRQWASTVANSELYCREFPCRQRPATTASKHKNHLWSSWHTHQGFHGVTAAHQGRWSGCGLARIGVVARTAARTRAIFCWLGSRQCSSCLWCLMENHWRAADFWIGWCWCLELIIAIFGKLVLLVPEAWIVCFGVGSAG